MAKQIEYTIDGGAVFTRTYSDELDAQREADVFTSLNTLFQSSASANLHLAVDSEVADATKMIQVSAVRVITVLPGWALDGQIPLNQV
jgi:hypothetical protein